MKRKANRKDENQTEVMNMILTSGAKDALILKVILDGLENREQAERIRGGLPGYCVSRFDELVEERFGEKKEKPDLDEILEQSDLRWKRYRDERSGYTGEMTNQEAFDRFISDRCRELGIRIERPAEDVASDSDCLLDRIGLREYTGWRDYVNRIGRGQAKDRMYLFRLYFVLRVSPGEADGLISITGQPGFSLKEEREFKIHDLLECGVYDRRAVNKALIQKKMIPLFPCEGYTDVEIREFWSYRLKQGSVRRKNHNADEEP